MTLVIYQKSDSCVSLCCLVVCYHVFANLLVSETDRTIPSYNEFASDLEPRRHGKVTIHLLLQRIERWPATKVVEGKATAFRGRAFW